MTGDESDSLAIPFSVNAIPGPALYLMPKRIKISENSQFQLDLWIDETDSIAGVSTKMLFDPQSIRIDHIDFLESESESFCETKRIKNEINHNSRHR